MNTHYGKPLSVKVKDGKLVIEIGIHTLAQAVSYADWANRYDERRQDYIRTFAITDPELFAGGVDYAMNREAEDGSTPLSDFLDKMSEAALDDGTEGAEYYQSIRSGEFSKLETWASQKSKAKV